jgi:hypothetical protein
LKVEGWSACDAPSPPTLKADPPDCCFNELTAEYPFLLYRIERDKCYLTIHLLETGDSKLGDSSLDGRRTTNLEWMKLNTMDKRMCAIKWQRVQSFLACRVRILALSYPLARNAAKHRE